MQDHYLYVYLDPRKPGRHIIAGQDFGYEPFYLGVSKNSYRKYQHLQEARKYIKTGITPTRNKRKVYKIASILKGGQTPIIKVVIDKLTESLAYNQEYQLVRDIGRVYDKAGPLLNFLPGGQIINAQKISDIKQRQDNLNTDKKREVQQLKDGIFINIWPSVVEAMRSTNISHIDACCRGDRNGAGGYVWKYTDNNIIRRDKYRKRKTNKVSNRKKVEQYTKDDIKINEYSSITNAAKNTGISRKNISNMLIGVSKTAGGYVWKYKK